MAAREDIIKKIKSLFDVNIENGSSENEALSAALMAQKLIVKYEIEESELYHTVEETVEEIESEPVYRKFKYTLADIVANSYRCCCYMRPVGKKTKFVFVGRNADAAAATLVFNKLYEATNDYANSKAWSFRGMGSGYYGRYYNSAALAFLDGVKIELEKQSQELLLVRSKSVDEKFEEITKGFIRKKVSMDIAGNIDHDAGVRAGQDAIRKTRLGSDSVKKFGR